MFRLARSHVDLKHMRTVVDVARTESITSAAQTLGFTQSAVSRTVAELEAALGQRLFDRSSCDIQLTDAGRRLVARHDHPLAQLTAPSEAQILAYSVILPQSIEPSHFDIARRYAELDRPPLKTQYVTNSFELMLMLVRVTGAFLLLLHAADYFGGRGRRNCLLRETVRIPPHFVSVAAVAQRSRGEVVGLFEPVLRSEFVTPETSAEA